MVSHGALRVVGRSFLRLARDREYRRLSALSARFFLYPRRRPSSIRIEGRGFAFPDAASFLSAYEEIWVNQAYRFRSSSEHPLILDLGANVGVSVLFFKRLYPRARIVALEPDPEMFGYLRRNVETFELQDVQLRNAAVWTDDARLLFQADGADGGHLASAGNGIEVEAVALRSLFSEPEIDFLKMDIEGAENIVLPACEDLLPRVRNIFVEYHSRHRDPQQLHRIVNALAGAGFRISIETVKHLPRPLMAGGQHGEFDLQLNIFGARS